MDKNRRAFLAVAGITGSAAIFVASGCGDTTLKTNRSNDSEADKPTTPKGKGVVIGPGQYKGQGGKNVTYVALLDLDADKPEVQRIPTDFFGHGVSPHPHEPHRALVFQKHGAGCCEVDLKTLKVIRKIPTVDTREFYGHGAWRPDGKSFYSVETVVGDSSYDGVVVVRDDEKAEIQGLFPTHGVAPHDCLLIHDGATLVFTNGGAPVGHNDKGDLPSVTYVDAKDEKLVERLTFDSLRYNAGHIAMTSKGDLAVVSAPRDGIPKNADATGAISFFTPGGKLRTPSDPILKKMKLETLSVAIHEPSMVVGCTSPEGHLVTFWDHKEGKLVKTFDGEFKKPRGISLTLDGKYFVVTYDVRTRIVMIDANTLEPAWDASGLDADFVSFMAGSHSIVHEL